KSHTWSILLAATALTTPAFAQTPIEVDASERAALSDGATSEASNADGAIEVSMAGGFPTVTVEGRRERNVQRETTQVMTVLSAEDIARTGEGDIAGALGRVTGLSVVGSGFVYVRGLGDRYSLALLNGSP